MTSKKRRLLLVATVGILAATAGGLFSIRRSRDARDKIAAAIMAIRLSDLDGQTRWLGQWRGQVLLVNLWATWCAPCREEIPVFVKLQEKYQRSGLQIIGIAIDRLDKVRTFARQFTINYPVLLGGIEVVDLSRQLGNHVGALPFTLIFNRDGIITATTLGQIKEARLVSLIESLLQKSSPKFN